MDKDLVVKELQTIVDEFNKFFSSWSERHGCVATLGWEYSPYAGVGRRPLKSMIVSHIDYIVYRKPAPSPETLSKIMGKEQPDEEAKP